MKTKQTPTISTTSLLVALLLSGCGDARPPGLDAGDRGSDTDTQTDSGVTDTGSDTSTQVDSGVHDAGPDTDSETDSGVVDNACSGGPCCDGSGRFKEPSDKACGRRIEHRCNPGICGSSKSFRFVDVRCSGTSAECNGDTSDEEWIPLSPCDFDEVCKLSEGGVASCVPCGSLKICRSGRCACEFETCGNVCCEEGLVCGWTGTCTRSEVKLLPADGVEDERFGHAVAISAGVAVIGVYWNDNNATDHESAHIFERDELGSWTKETVIIASDGRIDDRFGASVSVSGTFAIIGAPNDNDKGANSGSAYIFERDDAGMWIQKKKLLASDGAPDDGFGGAVSVSGNFAIIGAGSSNSKGTDSGAAYMFERNESGDWVQKATLLASDGTADDRFGESVSVSGNFAIIGASRDGDNEVNSGSAYIFERNESGTWEQKSKLVASDGAQHDGFGRSVSVSGNLAIIGASGNSDNGNKSGSAYIFEPEGSGQWTQTTKLLPSDGMPNDRFGAAVSVSGNFAVIGADGDSDNGIDSGSAYIFERIDSATWAQRAKLRPPNDAAGDRFGFSASISGDVAIIGASDDDDKGQNAGAAYIF